MDESNLWYPSDKPSLRKDRAGTGLQPSPLPFSHDA